MELACFVLILAVFALYSLLDGFDLGIGMLNPFLRDKKDFTKLTSLIAPVWDGNEVWIIIGGSLFFAVFPAAFALLLPAIYIPIIFVVLAFILRAVSFEFSYHDTARQELWLKAFSLGSLAIGLLGLMAMTRVLEGLPMEGPGKPQPLGLAYLSPYALLFTLAGLCSFVWHGLTFASTRQTMESLDALTLRFRKIAMAAPLLLGIALGGMSRELLNTPFALVAVTVYAAAFWASLSLYRKPGTAFKLSMLSIAAIWVAAGILMYPYIIPCSNAPEWGLVIAGNASPAKTLKAVLTVSLIILPIMLLLTALVYRIFKKSVPDIRND